MSDWAQQQIAIAEAISSIVMAIDTLCSDCPHIGKADQTELFGLSERLRALAFLARDSKREAAE